MEALGKTGPSFSDRRKVGSAAFGVEGGAPAPWETEVEWPSSGRWQSPPGFRRLVVAKPRPAPRARRLPKPENPCMISALRTSEHRQLLRT